MTYRFKKHYTVEEARALLPPIREWLEELTKFKDEVDRCEKRLEGLLAPGADLGGDLVNRSVKALVAMREILFEFFRREILIKDIDRGLVDFPALVAGKEVFLCWEKSEDDIEYWHDLDTGFAGREHL
jgi:hypothetical protein